MSFPNFNRGEVYFVDFGVGVGHEQSGYRPAVVVSCDDINRRPLVVTVVPGTSRNKLSLLNPAMVPVPAGEAGLTQRTVFLTFQARAFDHSRFSASPSGVLSPQYLADLEQALAWTFEL